MYDAVLRLYSLGYADGIALDMRPWTRTAFRRLLAETETMVKTRQGNIVSEEVQDLYEALRKELVPQPTAECLESSERVYLESAYIQVRGLTGHPLRDSFHLGSSIVDDYGRPFAHGANSYTGLSAYATAGRFTLYARAETQTSPSATGYSAPLAEALSQIDLTYYADPTTGAKTFYFPQATIPEGPLPTLAQTRFLEAYVSANVLHHVISLGKSDQWLGPARGAAFAYSNNAENIYAFEVNRSDPLRVPGLSRYTGPFRYEFLVGKLHGHAFIPNPAYEAKPSPNIPNVITPGDPWLHLEKVSFRPTRDLEFGFERTVIWGGKGHAPITMGTFLTSFFSTTAPGGPGSVGPNRKFGRDDPGARFSAFDLSYRLPFAHKSVLLYADGEVHDDVSPIDAPQRASWRPGIYLSRIPRLNKLDFRSEAVLTDPPVNRSVGGQFMYYEYIQRQGYTNNGQILGDWIGREAKGGQAWVTWHLSGNEWLQFTFRNQKTAKDFIATPTEQLGTTLNDYGIQAVKRLQHDLELRGDLTVERYKAPIYRPGLQTVTTVNLSLTWYPHKTPPVVGEKQKDSTGPMRAF